MCQWLSLFVMASFCMASALACSSSHLQDDKNRKKDVRGEIAARCPGGKAKCVMDVRYSAAEKPCRQKLESKLASQGLSEERQFETKIFTDAEWKTLQKKVLVFKGENLKVKGADGTWTSYRYRCEYDGSTGRALKVYLQDASTEVVQDGCSRSEQPPEIELGRLNSTIFRREGCVTSAMVFLHGATGNMHSLRGLAEGLKSADGYDFIFLNAPYMQSDDPEKRVWFPYQHLLVGLNGIQSEITGWVNGNGDLSALQGFLNGLQFPHTEYDQSLKWLSEAMEQIYKSYSQVLMVGYSQGGMMAMHHVFKEVRESIDSATDQSHVKGLILLSTVVGKPEAMTLLKDVKRHPSPKVLQIHMDGDGLIPLGLARGIHDRLMGVAFADTTFMTTVGTHEDVKNKPELIDGWMKEKFP